MIEKTLHIGEFQYLTQLYTEEDFGISEVVYDKFVMLRNFTINNDIINDTHIYIMDKSTWQTLCHELRDNQENFQNGFDKVKSIVFPIQTTELTGFTTLYNEFNYNFTRESFYSGFDENDDPIPGNDVYQILDANGDEARIKCNKLRIYHPVTKKFLKGILSIENHLNGIHWYYLCNTIDKFPYNSETEIRRNNNIYSEYIEIDFPDIDWLFRVNKFDTDKDIYNAYFDERLNTVISVKNDNYISKIIIDEVERYYKLKFTLNIDIDKYENIAGDWLFYIGNNWPLDENNELSTNVNHFSDTNKLFNHIKGNMFPLVNEDEGKKYILMPEQFKDNIIISNVLNLNESNSNDALSLSEFVDVIEDFEYYWNDVKYILLQSKQVCKKIKLHDQRRNINKNKYFYIGAGTKVTDGGLDKYANLYKEPVEYNEETGKYTFTEINSNQTIQFYDYNDLFENSVETTRYTYKYQEYQIPNNIDSLYVLIPTVYEDQFIFSDTNLIDSNLIFELQYEIIRSNMELEGIEMKYSLIRLDYTKNKTIRVYTLQYKSNFNAYSLYGTNIVENEYNINNYIDLQYQLVPLALLLQPYIITEDLDPILNDIRKVKLYLKHNKSIENNYIITPFNISIYPYGYVDDNTGQYIYDDTLTIANNTYNVECRFVLNATFGFNEEKHRAAIITKFEYPNKAFFLEKHNGSSKDALQDAYMYYNNINFDDYKYFWVDMLLNDDPDAESKYVNAYDKLYETMKFDEKGRIYIDIDGKKCYNLIKKINIDGFDELELPVDISNKEKIKRLIDINYDNLWDQLRDWEIEEEYETNMDFFGFRIQIMTDQLFKNIIYNQTYSIDITSLDDFSFDLNNIFENWYELPDTLLCYVTFIDHIKNNVIAANYVVITKEYFKYMINDNNLFNLDKINHYNNMLKEINLDNISGIKQSDITTIVDEYYDGINTIVKNYEKSINDMLKSVNECFDNDSSTDDPTIEELKTKINRICNNESTTLSMLSDKLDDVNEGFKENYINNYSPFNFINNINCVINRQSEENLYNIKNNGSYTPKIIFQPIYFKTQDLQNIRIRSEVIQNIGVNLSKYMSKVETFKLVIDGLTFVEAGRNDSYVIFEINAESLSATSGTYNIVDQDNQYIASGSWQKY